METKTCRLDGPETTLVFAWDDGVPALIYHGARLPADTDLGVLASTCRPPLPQATLDIAEPVSLHPEAGRGFAGHPALIGHRKEDGAGWAGRFTIASVDKTDHGVIFSLIDRPRRLALDLDCRIDPGTDVAVFRSRLENQGQSSFTLDWLSAPVIAPTESYGDYLGFHGRWCAEFGTMRAAIPPGTVVRENRRGRTSHDSFPGLILLTPTTGEDQGVCLGAHLGWSGNHRLILERLPGGDVQLQMGVLLLPGEGELVPGAAFETPPLYIAHADHGLNAMSQKLHAYVRRHLLKLPVSGRARPVTVNTWEAIYFDHGHDLLTSLADAAAAIGAERFVLDDGWFEGRDDDTTSLGDWYPDSEKYPDGLGPIADHVHRLGMEFGLWVEPEMVNPKSELFQRHPDWALGLAGYPMVTGRNQLVLDIARPEVSDYLFERIASLVGDHRIDYLKWDMNRDHAASADDQGRAAGYRQVNALYALIDRLLEAFPKLEIESCASGGGRVDYGILERTHRFWPSDSNDAVERVWIQTGFSYFFPPEIMGAHIGPAWSHTSGRGLSIGLRSLVASYGHMGVEANLTGLNAAERESVRDAIERYKADRPIWHEGRFSRLRTLDPSLVGTMAVTEDQLRARLILVQTDRPRAALPPRLAIRGLRPDQPYRVALQAISDSVERANRRFENPLWRDGFTLSGAVLARAGIGLPVLYAQTALAIAIDAV